MNSKSLPSCPAICCPCAESHAKVEMLCRSYIAIYILPQPSAVGPSFSSLLARSIDLVGAVQRFGVPVLTAEP